MPRWQVALAVALLLPALLLAQFSRAGDVRESPVDCDTAAASSLFHVKSGGENISANSIRCEQGRLILDFGVAEADTALQLDRLERRVRDEFGFFGLAGFYATTHLYVVNAEGISSISDPAELGDQDWLSVAGRFRTIGLSASGARLSVGDGGARLQWPPGSPVRLTAITGNKNELADIEAVFEKTRYTHLWNWLGALSRAVEWSLENLRALLGLSWGWAIVIFAVVMKVLLLPVAVMTLRLQRSVSSHQTQLEPVLKDIKEKYDGEDAHNRIMAAHKSLGITPFFTLKPMLGSFIQVPILVAIFNALGEMPQLAGESFLWIGDLAYPDSIGRLPFDIPLLGKTLSLLPFVMTVVTIASTLHYRNPHAPASAVQSQKMQLYLMAAGFFVLFYPFPAAMLLYWTMANILQWAQQQLVRI